MKKILMLLTSMLAVGTTQASVLNQPPAKAPQEDALVKETTELLKCPPAQSALATQVAPTPAAVPSVVPDKAVAIKPAMAVEPTEVAVATDALPADLSEEEILPQIKNLTPTDKLKAYRVELEKRNLVLLEKKMEIIRLQQEMALLKNLEKSMNKTLNAISDL